MRKAYLARAGVCFIHIIDIYMKENNRINCSLSSIKFPLLRIEKVDGGIKNILVLIAFL